MCRRPAGCPASPLLARLPPFRLLDQSLPLFPTLTLALARRHRSRHLAVGAASRSRGRTACLPADSCCSRRGYWSMTQQAPRRSWSIVFGPPLPRILPLLTFITSCCAPLGEGLDPGLPGRRRIGLPHEVLLGVRPRLRCFGSKLFLRRRPPGELN